MTNDRTQNDHTPGKSGTIVSGYQAKVEQLFQASSLNVLMGIRSSAIALLTKPDITGTRE